MSFTHVLLCVDEFSLVLGGTSIYAVGALQEELRLNGWFLAGGDLQSLEAVFASANGEGERHIAIEDRFGWSEGVWHGYGVDFGEKARHCRFQTTVRLADHGIDPAQGRLRAVMADGVVIERALGTPRRDAVTRDYTPDERALVARFESIGENCELGLVQRRVGFERMSLLRFVGVHDAPALAQAVSAHFAGFAEGDALRATVRDGEWIVEVDGVHLDAHTGRPAGTITHEAIIAQERTRLRFLADKFLEDIAEPERVFVYRALRGGRGGPDGLRGMDALYDALCSHGAMPLLLWVSEADDAHPANTVEHVRGSLHRGWIRRMTPHFNAFLYDVEAWLDFLAAVQPLLTGGPDTERTPALAGAGD